MRKFLKSLEFMKVFNKLFFFLSLIFFANIVGAQSEGLLNKLLAPGPLILGHQDLEGKDCLKCHDAGKGISDTKCMDCHKDIKKSFDLKKGFHGLNTGACMKCHSDHKGRDFDSTRVDEKTFDHKKMTGYSLEGKHSKIKCMECHKEKRTEKFTRKKDMRFLIQAATCVSCHKKDDIHLFKDKFAKKDCNECHSNTSWKTEIRFNHNTDTTYKLEDSHALLKCNDCHQPDKKQKKIMKYNWPNLKQAQCLACHDDFHKKNLSSRFANGNCTTCHTQLKWKIEKFDHSITKFKLNDKHAEAQCVECHRPPQISKNMKLVASKFEIKKLNFTGLKTQCLSCHEDFHRFGKFVSVKMGDLNNCLKCHNEKGWQQIHNFDHNMNTKFAINGQHESLKCTTCHLPNPKDLKTDVKKLFTVSVPTYHWNQLDTKTCESCHKSPHIGVFSPKLLKQKCTDCHTDEGWDVVKSNSSFDHSKTRFDLTGAHKQVKCSDCHGPSGKQVFKFTNFKTDFCTDCHTNIHTNQFSATFSAQKCSLCHSTQKFNQLLDFDHSKTRYPLLGEHSKTKCSECHKPTTTQITLKWPNFKTKVHTEFKSIFKSQFLFPDLKPNQCLTCHQDYHKGQLSNNCTDCHSEKGWKPQTFDHNKQSKFLLKDKHAAVDCVQCHKASTDTTFYKEQKRYVLKYKPLKTNCIDCHTDYHKGQLSNNCNECHNEKGWKPQTFDHNKQSKFILRAKHLQIDCVKCHLPTKESVLFNKRNYRVLHFKPLGVSCVECHKDPHKGSFGNSCKDCHTEQSWAQTKDFHKNFNLTGVHYSLNCIECHKENKKLAGLSQQCLSCHQKDDVHNGMLPNCKACHTQHFWEASQFKHSLTKFPLRGAHRTLDCAECHTNGIYKGLSTSCVSCHLSSFVANPAPHVSGNTNCLECHRNTFTFKSDD